MSRTTVALTATGGEIPGGHPLQARALTRGPGSEGYDVLFGPINPSFPQGLRAIRCIPAQIPPGHGVVRPGSLLIIFTPNRLLSEGLSGYYRGEKTRGWRWTAWNETRLKIYPSFEFLKLLEHCGWSVERVVGYGYQGQLPQRVRRHLPVSSTSSYPLNSLGFSRIAVPSPLRSPV